MSEGYRKLTGLDMKVFITPGFSHILHCKTQLFDVVSMFHDCKSREIMCLLTPRILQHISKIMLKIIRKGNLIRHLYISKVDLLSVIDKQKWYIDINLVGFFLHFGYMTCLLWQSEYDWSVPILIDAMECVVSMNLRTPCQVLISFTYIVRFPLINRNWLLVSY